MKKGIAIIIIFAVLLGGALFVQHNKNSDNTSNSSGTTSTSNSDTSNMPDMSTSTPAPNSTQATATDKVTIRNFAFSPANITVKKGTTVTWTNQDSTAHTVTETDGQNGPKSDLLNMGQSYTFTFNTAGTFKYECSVHPQMTGTVTVTE
jgi:plastocyanin